MGDAVDVAEGVATCILEDELEATNGADAKDMEELTGLPVCSLIETAEQLSQLATWLAADTVARSTDQPTTLAMAG